MNDDAHILTNGFKLINAKSKLNADEFLDHQKVRDILYPECESIAKQLTNAHTTYAFNHIARSEVNQRDTMKGKTIGRGRASHIVHNDYSGDFKKIVEENPAFCNAFFRRRVASSQVSDAQRWVIVNMWRNIQHVAPILDQPLALCDPTSIDFERDLLAEKIDKYKDLPMLTNFAVYASRFSPLHRWYYYPQMTASEVLVFKTFDAQVCALSGLLSFLLCLSQNRSLVAVSANLVYCLQEPFCNPVLHTAFIDSQTPEDAPGRESIEVRVVCLIGSKSQDFSFNGSAGSACSACTTTGHRRQARM
jgi:hypothetical protein